VQQRGLKIGAGKGVGSKMDCEDVVDKEER